jgi:hypothetical protein
LSDVFAQRKATARQVTRSNNQNSMFSNIAKPDRGIIAWPWKILQRINLSDN